MSLPRAIDRYASDEALRDLSQRLRNTRWPEPVQTGWSLGTDSQWLRSLVEYWQRDYDWRGREAWMAEHLPAHHVGLGEVDLHYSHVPSAEPGALPLLLLHGWPSTHLEMHKLVGPLTDPVAHGGQAEDAFHVVVGSLPGHGFSSAPADPRYGADEAAVCFQELMVDVLGYTRFGAHGGDRGAFVATGLAHRFPEHLVGIHQVLPMGVAGEPPSDAEEAWLRETARWSAEEGGYSAIQGTRPVSLAYGLTDSPVGLAGWICEKFWAWADCDGDPLNAFTREELLDTVMVYWLSGSLYSSVRMYWAHRQRPPVAVGNERIECPTGMTVFPKEVMRPPRSAVERKYDLRFWHEAERGGHFPALEAPEVLIGDLRRFFRGLR
jgi:microsomal epoxide hydrolase